MPRITSAAATHPGLRRPANEDAFCRREDLGLYVVADGMGGHAAGEVASRLAVDSIERFISETRDQEAAQRLGVYDDALSPGANRLKGAFHSANQSLNEAVTSDHALRGMATTAAAVLITDDRAALAHVGDSRIYLWHDGHLRLMTEDHSWVGEQVRAGILSAADAQHHPWRNVVTRAIAGGPDPAVDVADVALAPGDRVLLCSDGLSAVVSHERLELVFAAGRSLQETCDALVAAANDAGGPDNITILTLHFDVA